ncbi:hypothetical protein CLU79DRAFT_88849 [Phycomyces nitens]|nr:hypothetical protein CLU79DRAFT_88849 [Phycomyces nitens]
MVGAKLINYKSSLAPESLHRPEDELYYVSGIVRSIQTIKDWSDLRSPKLKLYTNKPMSEKLINSILEDESLLEENLVNSQDIHKIVSNDAKETDTTNIQPEDPLEHTSQDPNEDEGYVWDIYYPFWDKEQSSCRALSILALLMMCKASSLCNTVDAQEVIRVLILQIVDGLRETESKQEFNELVNRQTRNRVEKWRKYKKFKKRVILRPILNDCEEQLVSSYISCLPNVNQANGILKALEITDKPQPSKMRKEQAFYLRTS